MHYQSYAVGAESPSTPRLRRFSDTSDRWVVGASGYCRPDSEFPGRLEERVVRRNEPPSGAGRRFEFWDSRWHPVSYGGEDGAVEAALGLMDYWYGDMGDEVPWAVVHPTSGDEADRLGVLVGNAKWLGIPLSSLVEEAGVRPEGTQLIGRSVDGFTAGFPTAALFDGREALLAVGMNGETLPFKHGFPARLVVSGLYGYVSATKWLSEIEFARWEDFDAYWVPRGWAKEAPIKTQSRIDFPRPGRMNAGPITIAGVAWAQSRGISRVEVSVNGEDWRQAEMPEELSIDSWRQWKFEENFSPGMHIIAVRAADGTGQFQTAERVPARPDGATGYHTISVNVV